MTLSDLARLSGVSKPHLDKIELGDRTPTLPIAYRISRALKRSIYDVFPEKW
ncbi:hypothetical protein SDC9_57800 [bioreactor metagenome]|uniref:HTH cro/C1-type domain-containing protein n=1 Tax=bioreactor metagenome TaxID=1076179 RepID=A0A644X5N2_9ZZZZ